MTHEAVQQCGLAHAIAPHQANCLAWLYRKIDIVKNMACTIVRVQSARFNDCLLYTSDAADERSSVDLGGRRTIKNKNKKNKKNSDRGQRIIRQSNIQA